MQGKDLLSISDLSAQDLRDLAGQGELARTQTTLRQALIDHLAGFDRPMVENGQLRVTPFEVDERAAREDNPWAYRGPMRYGVGYDGYNK